MSMHYYNRRHSNDEGGSQKVTTLSNLSLAEKPVEKVEDEVVEKQPLKRLGRKKK